MRVKIFVDFWNFQIAWNKYHEKAGAVERVKISWEDKLPMLLTDLVGKDAIYAGTHVYASIDPGSEKDRGLRRFLHAMDGFQGYVVTVKERQWKGPPKCSHAECRKEITHCPHCKNSLRRTVEKGIDTALVVDLIQMAFDDIYDRAILLSADKDHVGAVTFIQQRSKQITHVWFKHKGQTLRNACWDHYFLEQIMEQLLPPGEPAVEVESP